MKGSLFALLIVGIVFFLRINLAPNNINNNVQIQSNNLLDKTITSILLTDSVADWQYIDFIQKSLNKQSKIHPPLDG